MYRSILVPLDGSTFSEQALPTAQSIARRLGATLHLVHVHYPVATSYLEGMPIIDEELDASARVAEHEWLTRLHARLAVGSQQVRYALLDGPIADALLNYVITHAIDLVVLPTHGRGGVARTWMGSVGDALMRQSAAPVLLLHAGSTEAQPISDAAFRHVVIPLDSSAAAERVIEYTLALGSDRTEYTLLLVINRPLLGSSVAHEMEIAEGYLQRITAPLRAAGHNVQAQVLVGRHAAGCIVAVAAEQQADLIAMTTHGRSGLTRLVIGSTADQVVRNTTIPVLVLRPTDHMLGSLARIDYLEDLTTTL